MLTPASGLPLTEWEGPQPRAPLSSDGEAGKRGAALCPHLRVEQGWLPICCYLFYLKAGLITEHLELQQQGRKVDLALS